MLLECRFVLRRKKTHRQILPASGSRESGVDQNLKRSSNAFLAPVGSFGFWLTAAVVSRSNEVRPENNGQSFATSLGDTRAGIFSAHSRLAPGSKFTHWTQDRKS